jgi:uncharacterized protein (DUF302 family)
MKQVILAGMLAGIVCGPATADTVITHVTTDAYEDVTFAIESAIVSQGLVIDMISHTGDMLARTRGDIENATELFVSADIFVFCSASISRQVMEADINNFQYCPYGIHVYELPETAGHVNVSYTERSTPSMAPVNALLGTIVAEALDLQ